MESGEKNVWLFFFYSIVEDKWGQHLLVPAV